MKKTIKSLLFLLIIGIMLSMTAFAMEYVTVTVGDTELSQKGVLVDGRTLIPVRALSEALNAAVGWDADTQMVTLSKLIYKVNSADEESIEARKIYLWINKKEVSINGYTDNLDVAPQLINNLTMIPVRAVSQWFEATVAWDEATQTVKITKGYNESFADARFQNQLRQKSERDTINRLTSEKLVFKEVWVSEYGLDKYNLAFLYGGQYGKYKEEAGFYKGGSLSGIVGDMIYKTPSFDKSFLKNGNQTKEIDGITMKCENGTLYFEIDDLKTLGIIK